MLTPVCQEGAVSSPSVSLEGSGGNPAGYRKGIKDAIGIGRWKHGLVAPDKPITSCNLDQDRAHPRNVEVHRSMGLEERYP